MTGVGFLYDCWYLFSGIGAPKVCGVGFLSDPWCIFNEIGVVKRVVCSFQSLYSFGVLFLV